MPFIVIVAIAIAIALIMLDPPRVLFAIFCLYGLSGYAVYGWRRLKGRRASVIAMSTDEPEEEGLPLTPAGRLVLHSRPMTFLPAIALLLLGEPRVR